MIRFNVIRNTELNNVQLYDTNHTIMIYPDEINIYFHDEKFLTLDNETLMFINKVHNDLRERREDELSKLDLIGDDVDFERIRRITGYLVGDVKRFNNAKQQEESERVYHER